MHLPNTKWHARHDFLPDRGQFQVMLTAATDPACSAESTLVSSTDKTLDTNDNYHLYLNTVIRRMRLV